MVDGSLLDPDTRHDSVSLPHLQPETDVQLLLAAQVSLHAVHVFLHKQEQHRMISSS